jgi:phosphate transport system protein
MAALKDRLTAYALLVEGMIRACRLALAEGREDLLERIIGGDEDRANQTEMDLEAEGASLIAQHQPMARELRTILAILHLTTDLERMADHAVNIAEALGGRAMDPDIPRDAEVIRIFDVTLGMVADSIRAFIEDDAALGRRVCETDAVVDELASRILVRLSGSMSKEPARVTYDLMLLKIAANLERIADLSTNIGEDVIYMVEGRVIKHHRAS